MTTSQDLFTKDHKHIWHPYTQSKILPTEYLVKEAKGEYLFVENSQGKELKIIDGISSWWVNIHGHSNHYIQNKIIEQLQKHQQVIFAGGISHETAIQLIDKLLPMLPKADITCNAADTTILDKAFFSDNGSTSVEVALKMAVQYFHNNGQTQKNKFIAFKDSYHGDTVGTMSVADRSVFNQAFRSMMFEVDLVDSPAGLSKESLARVTIPENISREAFKEISEDYILRQIEKLLRYAPDQYAGVIIEPLVQGSAGMKFHRAQFLQKLRKLCKNNNLLLIADEVFTGFGRTGADFACKNATIVPDIICLSKALTGGFLPMGLTITSQEIYSAFHDDSRLKTFFHGHSYTGNSLACAAALASIELYQKENRLEDVRFINSKMKQYLIDSKLESLEHIEEVRVMGAIAAIEFDIADTGYLSELGPYLYQEFLKRQILLRPLGNVLYFLPPYTMTLAALDYTLQSIVEVSSNLKIRVKA
ncbi:MAG: adenosylmethionine--8-amino-7-oxononanoate transaminase [Candidatus Caenarcaniphilales bacterium]|jgi:adenosylmethionine-8-amino-7-oxononanoate aminotransferase|nr:adenosylmethionine--8-amino-7-oxononanoate transaminase [Candidatus Caenarcaniphilales bacterium]